MSDNKKVELSKDENATDVLNYMAGLNKSLLKALCFAISGFLITIALIVGGFIWYLNQYDFETSVEATGVYTNVNSDGNIAAQDVSEELWQEFLKYIQELDKNKK